MSTSLYQKYRPQSFADLVGQDHIRTTLLNELTRQATAHAYLFSGPRGIGKTTVARLLARAVNCEHLRDGEPCNECGNCRLIIDGKALDIIEIDAASHTGVDHVREHIIDNARVAPSRLPRKVFIIDEVHMLSTSAFNALLKTLEEPPKHTVFILATTEIHKVPATIISRCEWFTFRRVSFTDMVTRLHALADAEGVEVDGDVLEAIARRSEGALRDAESLLGQVCSLQGTRITRDIAEVVLPHSDLSEMLGLFEEIAGSKTADAIVRVNRLLEEGLLFAEFTKDFIEFLRKMLLYRVQESLAPLAYLDVQSDMLDRIVRTTSVLSTVRLARMVEAFVAALEQMKTASIVQLPIELAIVELTAAQHETSAVFQGTSRRPRQALLKQQAASASTATVAAATTTNEEDEEVGEVGAEKGEGERKKEQEGVVPPPAPSDDTPASAAPSELTMEVISSAWPRVQSLMKKKNHALHLTLQVGTIVSFQDGVLTLGFQYQFYQDRLQDHRNAPLIEEVLQQSFGTPVTLNTVVGQEYGRHASPQVQNIEQPSETEVSNVWDLAAHAFGSPQSE